MSIDSFMPSWLEQHDVDLRLHALVATIEKQNRDGNGDMEVPIRLHLPGGAIAGSLVAAERWGRVTLEAINDETTRVVAASLVSGEAPDDRDEDDFFRVHLIGVRYPAAAGWSQPSGTWRGRIKDVSGWALGAPS